MYKKKEHKLNSVSLNCENCGGNLVFMPSSQKLGCENCGSLFDIEQNKEIVTHLLSDNENDDQYDLWVEQNKIFKCSNCGSSIILNKYEISKNCPYCQSSLILSNNSVPGKKPDGVVPFVFDEENAAQKFVMQVKKKFFLPNKFKSKIPENKITGIYIPAFAFNSNTSSTYSGSLYREVEVSRSIGAGSEKTFETTRESFYVSGEYAEYFKNILVESSSKISQYEVSQILPYNYSYLLKYNDAFIRGYSVEHYETKLDNCVQVYKEILQKKVSENILKKYSCDGVNYLNVDTKYLDESYSYYLVPLYMFQYDFNGQKYITYMNGQTGKIDTNLPKSKVKIALVILAIVLISLAIIILSNLYLLVL